MRLQSIFGYFGVYEGGVGGAGEGTNTEEVSTASPDQISPKVAEMIKPMTPDDLDAAMEKVSQEVQPWETGSFTFVKNLQDAIRNHGRVDLMRNEQEAGRMVAVKRMPNRWVRSGPKEFSEQYPTASEKPWCDLALVRQLNLLSFPFACQLVGVFRNSEETYVASQFCAHGDLFAWCDRESVPPPGPDREQTMLPIITQILTAVRWLHELGIAHRDLSLENILLTDSGPSGECNVKIIDFGMATIEETCRKEVRGKLSYQAPEMHVEGEYDTFLADEFALGVVIFAMAAQDYPWTCTKRNSCQLFEYVSMFGLRRFLEKRKLRKGNGEYLIEVFTPALTEMVEAILQVQPRQRATLGEGRFAEQVTSKLRRSVWDMRWLGTAGTVPGFIPTDVHPGNRIAGG